MKSALAQIVLFVVMGASALAAPPAGFANVPGVVIDHIPAASGIYLGSPGIAILPDGSYLASHNEFGPKSQYHGEAVTRVFRSTDKGQSWTEISKIDGCLWASLFVHGEAVYLWGTNREYGDMLIRRSTDGGRTWTQPKDQDSGLLAKGNFHCAPVPVVVHGGRVWRAWEEAQPGKRWGENFRAFVMSAARDADLLKAESWTRTNALPRDPAWLGGKFGGWLEGNAVVTPEGKVVDVLRVDNKPEGRRRRSCGSRRTGRRRGSMRRRTSSVFPGGRRSSRSGLMR